MVNKEPMSIEDAAAYLEVAATPTNGADLAKLTELAEAQRLAETELELAEVALAKAKDKLAGLAERAIPEVMEGLGLK